MSNMHQEAYSTLLSISSQAPIADKPELPSLKGSLKSDDGPSIDNASSSSVQIKEAYILQERRIGLWGAISLIMNKIIGSGSSTSPSRNQDSSSFETESSLLRRLFLNCAAVRDWLLSFGLLRVSYQHVERW
ncbi:methionine permease [Penicillium riverlandense]|uniref:methionine permease n=1 Tax=Penicillium riverlandense TaxID=1903569 RepID=UPI0025489C26|nr:methionine permease [Penicillium riverlandense]KAJ5825759.1 methionine permease [Penicillium riverlandense]